MLHHPDAKLKSLRFYIGAYMQPTTCVHASKARHRPNFSFLGKERTVLGQDTLVSWARNEQFKGKKREMRAGHYMQEALKRTEAA